MSKGTALVRVAEKATQAIKVEDAPRVAQELNTRFGTRAPGTREGVVTAIKNIIRDNPGKATIVATILAGLGIAGVDALTDAAQDYLHSSEYDAALDGGAILAAFQAAQEMTRQHLEELVGDGKVGTVLGQPSEDFQKDIGQLKQQFDLIETGIAFCGSLGAFERLREAMFSVEPQAITAYRVMRGG